MTWKIDFLKFGAILKVIKTNDFAYFTQFNILLFSTVNVKFRGLILEIFKFSASFGLIKTNDFAYFLHCAVLYPALNFQIQVSDGEKIVSVRLWRLFSLFFNFYAPLTQIKEIYAVDF